jgi:hypothetical protein
VELDNLRVIHLFEADFNLMIGILFGRRAMYHQVNKNLLNPAQLGRPGGECADATIAKVLHNLTSQLSQTPMGQFESDATACFDREIMKFVLTCYHSAGAPLRPLKMWEQVLHNIEHKVKTAYGISHECYSFAPTSLIHGPGQGSKGGTSSCPTLTSILIDGMPRLCNGLQFTDPAQQLQYEATVNIFVDVASNGTNRFLDWLHEPPSAADVVEMTRHDSQTWERFLWTSGGLLNLTKCAYYILAWNFDPEGTPVNVPKQAIPSLSLTSGDSPKLLPVKQLNFNESHKYLGNHLTTGMHMTEDAHSALQTTALYYASRLLCSPLSKRDAWIAYFAVFVPSMTYTLPVSHHPPTQASKKVTVGSIPGHTHENWIQQEHPLMGGVRALPVRRPRIPRSGRRTGHRPS